MPQVQDPEILRQLEASPSVQPQPGGGLIITDTTAQQKAQADVSEKTFRTMTAEETAEMGLPEGGVYQINGLGEIKTIQAAPSPQSAKDKEARNAKLIAADRLQSQLDQMREIYNRSFRGVGPGSILEYIPTEDAQKFSALARTMRADLKPLIRGPGEGTFTEGDQKLLDQLIPGPRELDSYNEQLFNELQSRIDGTRQQFSDATNTQVEERENPLTATGEQQTEVTGSGDILTPEDRELQARLNEAYQGGAPLEQLQAISQEYGRSFPIGTQEELDAAREQGRSLNVDPSGRRTAAQEMLGQAADSPAGAFFVQASNALLSGGMDELAPVLGLDAETVQAAKEMLREKYPVSSFAGDVTGQTMQLAAGGAGVRAAGGGARALGATEIAQSAAYGAGESNENRLAGAALGAGGAVAGQQIARKIAGAPQAQATVNRIAEDGGTTPEAVTQALSEAVEAADGGAARVADDFAAAPDAQAEFGALAQQAIGRGRSAQDAQEKLAIMAQVDPEAKASAERLGLDLPTDVLSNDARILTATGLARSQINSDAQAAWGQTVSNTLERVDETLREIGAAPRLAQVSDDVRDRLQSEMATLERQGDRLRREVDDAINVRDRVDASSLQSVMAETIQDMGGLAEAKKAFSGEEKKLLAMLGEGERANRPTYARLNQMRDQIGRALFKNQGPWTDAPTSMLKRLYGALADDQLAYVESVGGRELADKMRGSNDLFTKMYGVRDTMQSLYGKTLQGDIGPLINRAITGASGKSSDGKALRQILSDVPEDLRAPALLSGMMAQAQRGSGQGGFSFSKYAQMYRGLRENAPFYKQIADTIGPEAETILRDIYSISRRMDAAENKIVRTGASNQPLINALNAQGLLGRTMDATKRIGARAGGATAGGMMGGPVGASAGYELSAALESVLTGGGKDRIAKLHDLLSSEPFKELVEKTATGEASQSAINKTANSKQFRNFAKLLGISTFEGRKNWLQSATTVSATSTTRPDEQPASTIEVQ